MNLAILRKSRRPPRRGDIFVVAPPDGLFLYGRVIATGVVAGGFPNSNLIYLYGARSADKANIPELLRGQLLVPPMLTNNLPWTKGYLEFLQNRPIAPLDRFPQHCFEDTRGWYFDEQGKRLTKPSDPVGQWGLQSFRTIDDEISKALGIPLAPA
jgi:hypothetical protein